MEKKDEEDDGSNFVTLHCLKLVAYPKDILLKEFSHFRNLWLKWNFALPIEALVF